MKVVDLEEIKLAKQIIKDFPDLINKLDICKNLLYNKRHYLDIATVINEIEESKIMLDLHLKVYQEVLKNAKET